MRLLSILLLLFIFQLKHFAADFPLQNGFMLRKFLPGVAFIVPLAAHAGVHAAFTFAIAFWWLWKPFMGVPLAIPLGLAAFDFVAHFAMDRLKASPSLLGRFKAIGADEFRALTHLVGMSDEKSHPEIRLAARNARTTLDRKMRSNRFFWWALGFDQMVHHLTHYAITAFLVTR